MINMAQKTTICCSLPSCGKTQSLHHLSSDPNIRKVRMNFIFNEVPDNVSKNLVLWFSERLKLKDDAVLTILDPTVKPHNCFYHVVTIALSVITDCLICTEYLCVLNLNHSSVHLWRMYAVKHTQLLANHSNGRLLLSLQSTKPIQTERSDEGAHLVNTLERTLENSTK